jgi:hypothetical protein
MIHLKRHDHPIQDDMCKESLEEIKALVKEKVYHTLNSKHSTIRLFASKSLSQHLFNEDGGNLVELLKGKQLNKMMDNFAPHPYGFPTFVSHCIIQTLSYQ